MLDVTPKNLRREITSLVHERDRHTSLMEDVVDQYVGSFYEEGREPEIKAHENHPFEHVVNTVPSLVYNNPRVNVRSRRPQVHRELSESLAHGLNRWIHDVNLADQLIEIAVDVQFAFGVALVTLEPVPGHEHLEHPPLRPFVTRVSWRRFFTDSRASSPRSARIMGHEWIADKEDLLEATYEDPETGRKRNLYNHKVLERIPPDADSDIKAEPWGDLNTVPRRQVRGFDVYIPERRMIYTLAKSGEGDDIGFLREPRPFFGPPWGPYIQFGIYPVPDEAYPLPPLATTNELVEELNAHLDQLAEQADTMRQFYVVNSANTKAVEAIKVARNGQVLAIPGYDSTQADVIELGRPSREQLEYSDRLRQRLDRKSGLTDFQRGNVTGDATATENQLAQAALDFRRRFMQRQFQKDVRRLLTTVAWYMAESRNVVFPIPVPVDQRQQALFTGAGTADFQVQMQAEEEYEDAVFQGGRWPGEDFNFFDLEIEIEPMSMELMTEAVLQRRIQQGLGFILANAHMMVSAPWINWPELLDDHFDALNIPDGRKYVNWRMVEMIAGAQFAGGAPQLPAGTGNTPEPDPKLLAGGSGVPQEGGGVEGPGQLAGPAMGAFMRANSAA